MIYGNGFESNQNFTEYRIYKIKGILNLKNVTDSTTTNDTTKNN